MPRSAKPPVPEQRKLIASKSVEDSRRRGTVINELIGWTDDGEVIHIPTGYTIPAPLDHSGNRRSVDPRAFVTHLLETDPQGWEATRNYKFGEKLTPALKQRLRESVVTFP